MKKLLITGFDPFGGESVNPAYEAVRLLPDVVAEIKLCKLKVPTEFVRSGAVLRDALAALPQWEGDKIFLRLIHDADTPFFSLKLRYEGERLAYAALDGKELTV